MRPREQPRPKATPIAIDEMNENRKMPMPWKIEETYISLPWNWDRVLFAVGRRARQIVKNMYSLVHNDTDGVIEDALPKDDAVKLRVDFVLIENC